MRNLAMLLLFASPALAQDLVLDGSAASDTDYVHVPFEVPAGVVELEIAQDDLSERNIIDFGLRTPSGFRGWGGGNEEPIVVGELASSRSYLSGPIEAGTWSVVLGRAKILDEPGAYHLEITFRDTATLAPEDLSEYAPAPALEDSARYYAGDLHVHSRESGDALASFAEIASLARERGLEFVVVTDHNTVSHLPMLGAAQAADPDVLFVPGIELTTYAGHAGVFGARDFVDHSMGHEGRDMAAALDDVLAQGALLSVNHPVLDLGDQCIGCAWGHEVDLSRASAVEIQTGASPLFTENAMAFWDSANDAGAQLAAVGGSDDHRAGIDLGFGQSPIGDPTTMIFAEELSEAALLAGIRAGRTVVKLTGPDAPMVELTSDPPRAQDRPFVTSDALTFTATVTGLGDEEVDLAFMKDGFVVERFPVDADPFSASLDVAGEPGARYRAELVRADGRRVTVTSDVWIEVPIAPPAGCDCDATSGAPAGLWLLLWVVLRAGGARRGAC